MAHEMASELTRNDEDVAMLFLVDTSAWFPKSLAYGREIFLSYAEMYTNPMKETVIKQMIEKMAFVQLGITRQDLDVLYEKHGTREKVIKVLEETAAEKNLALPLTRTVSCLEHELGAAKNAHNDWQPSKVNISGS